VRLDVGPQADAVFREVRLIAIEIVFETVEIDDQMGRIDIVNVHDPSP